MDKDILEQYLEIKGEIRDLKERIRPGISAGWKESKQKVLYQTQSEAQEKMEP